MASNCRAPDGGGDSVLSTYAGAIVTGDDADGARRPGSGAYKLYGV